MKALDVKRLFADLSLEHEAMRAGLRLREAQEAAEYQTRLEALRQALEEGKQSGESTRTHREIIAQAKAALDTQ